MATAQSVLAALLRAVLLAAGVLAASFYDPAVGVAPWLGGVREAAVIPCACPPRN